MLSCCPHHRMAGSDRTVIQRVYIVGVVLLLLATAGVTAVAAAGEPQVRVKIGEFARACTVVMPVGGQVLIDAAVAGAGPVASPTVVPVPAGSLVRIKAGLLTPARKQTWVMVGTARVADLAKQQQLRADWAALVPHLDTLPAGRIHTGDRGECLYDGRTLFFGVRFPVGAAAHQMQALVDKFAAAGKSSWLFDEILASATGRFSLTLPGGRELVGARVGFVAPRSNDPLTGGIIVKQVEHARGYAWHGFADRRYLGPLELAFGAQDGFNVIETVPLERLLAGIVPSEISANAQPAALMAQAVAARGEILNKLGMRHIGEGFHFCAEQHCQVYAGISPAVAKVAPAVQACHGQVLMGESGMVDAVYSANCGGHTDANHQVWTSTPDPQLAGTWDTRAPLGLDLRKTAELSRFLRHPPPAFCGNPAVEGGDKFRWTRVLDAKGVAEVVRRGGVGRLKDIVGLERGPSGRLCALTLVGENGRKTVLKELPIRKLFGGLPSACIIIEPKRNKHGVITSIRFAGAGWGHGVGMCQTGAQSMATLGFKFDAILLHYFPGARLAQAYR